MKRFLKILLWTFAGLVTFVFVAVMGAILWANSDSGQKKIASLIEGSASNEQMKLSLGALKGRIPAQIELVDLTLADRQGIWLRIDRARLVWSPMKLFDARLLVHDLSADNVEVLRKPLAPTAKPESVEKESGGGGIPAIPIGLSLENLGARRIHLAESILGQEAELSVSSHAEVAKLGDNLDLDLLIQRIDQTRGTVKAVLSFKPSTKVLNLNVQAHEPNGGMLVRTLKVPGLPELSMSLIGNGPISDWSARLDAGAGPDLTLDGTIGIQQKPNDLYELNIDLVSNITAFLEKKLQPLVGRKMKLESLVALDPKGNVHLEKLNLNIPAARISAHGKVNAKGPIVDMNYRVIAGDPELFAELAPGMSWQSLAINGKANGPATHPRIKSQLKVKAFEGFEFAMHEANVIVDAKPNKPFADPQMILGVNASGDIIGVQGPDPQIAEFAGEKIDWNILAKVFLKQERLEIQKTSLDTKVATLEIHDTQVKHWGKDVSLNSLIRVPDLSQFQELAGIDLSGRVDLHLNTRVKEFGQHIQADLSGIINQLRTGIEPADALLGDKVQLNLQAGVDPKKNIAVNVLKIITPSLMTEVSADLKSDEHLQAKYAIEFPDLNVLAEPLKLALAGPLKLTGEVDGKIKSPNVTARISTPHLALQGIKIQNARIDIAARDLATTPAGRVDADVTVDGLSALASVEYALKNNEDLTLKNIDLMALGTQITGALQVALKNTTANGKLKGEVVNMAELSDFIKQDLKGEVNFSVDLSDKDQQSAVLVADVKNFELGGATPVTIAGVQLNANVKNALNDPMIKSSVTVKNISAQLAEGETEVRVADVQLNANINNAVKTPDVKSTLVVKDISAQLANGETTMRVANIQLNTNAQDAIKAPAIQSVLEVNNISSKDANGVSTLEVAHVKLNADLKDALKDPQIKSSLRVKTITTAPAEIDVFTLNANGTQKDLQFDLATQGLLTALQQSLQVKSAGAVGVNGDEKRLQLASLVGNLGDVPFELLKPMLVKVMGKGLVVKDLDLRLDKTGQVKADIQIQEDGVQGSASLANLSLDLARVAGVTLPASGTINGDLKLGGSFADPEAVAKLNLNDIALEAVSEKDLQNGDASVIANWRQGTLEIVAALTQSQIGNLNIKGKMPLRLKQEPVGIDLPATTPLDATASGEIHLAILNDFISGQGHQVKGNLDLSGKISGVLEAPEFNVAVLLNEGEYENFNTGTLLKNIELLVKADPEQVKIEKLKANTPEQGTISVNGLVKKLEEDFDLDLKLVMDKAQLTSTDSIVASASSDIQFIGPMKKSRLQGKITVEQVDIYIPENLPPSVVVLDVEEEKTEEQILTEEAAKKNAGREEPEMEVGLDLEIDVPGKVYVRGRGLDTALGGNFTVTGTHLNPIISGDLKMRKGTLNVLNRQFNFSRGIISLDGVPRNEPTLDFVADAKPAKDAKMAVLVTGPVSLPNISLWSDPELPQDEILSRILFGKSAGAITPVEALELAASAAKLAGVGAGPGLVDNVRSSLGLDTLKFNNDDEDTGPGVEAGRYVAEGVYVGVKQGLQPGSTAATVQVDVTDHVKVESDIGADSSSRLGVMMEWDY